MKAQMEYELALDARDGHYPKIRGELLAALESCLVLTEAELIEVVAKALCEQRDHRTPVIEPWSALPLETQRGWVIVAAEILHDLALLTPKEEA